MKSLGEPHRLWWASASLRGLHRFDGQRGSFHVRTNLGLVLTLWKALFRFWPYLGLSSELMAWLENEHVSTQLLKIVELFPSEFGSGLLTLAWRLTWPLRSPA